MICARIYVALVYGDNAAFGLPETRCSFCEPRKQVVTSISKCANTYHWWLVGSNPE
jgi:hypothetical protein